MKSKIEEHVINKTLNDFRYNLALLRVSKGVSDKEMNEALGFSKGRIVNLEGKHHKPTFEEVVAIANYFRVSLGALLDKRLIVSQEKSVV